ncbi:MAG: hypothetical protein KIT75_01755 [Planctomycetota bacterium]|nr:hypothetical protein [Planctomycetota bacterium]
MNRIGLILLLLPLLLAGCPQPDNGKPKPKPKPLDPIHVIGPFGGTADADGGAPVMLTVSGQVTFDRLPVTASGLGGTPLSNPAANVLIEAVRHNDIFAVVGSTTTDASGNYTLNLNLTHDFYMRARATSGIGGNVDTVFHNRTSPPIAHAAVGPILNRAAGSQTANLHADTAQPHNRAGAFAILDTITRLRDAVAGSFANLGPLDVLWSNGGNLTSETYASGFNGNPTITLAGGSKADPLNTDHDEFDETVIAHEWASFLQLTQSRDNNFGGPHAGEELIYSAAYSEGVVTAIGCALLGTATYRDTTGFSGGATSVRFEFDLESGLLPGTGLGYGSEFRVSRVVWDLLDGGAGWPGDTDSDPVAIDAADFFASFAALKTRAAPYEVAWLASLLQQLIDDGHLSIADADTLMQSQGAAFPPAGGDSFPEVLAVGGANATGSLDAYSGTLPNPVLGPQANAVYRIELTSAQAVQLVLTNTTAGYNASAHKLVLSVHDLDRNVLGISDGTAASKNLNLNLAAGTYIVRVQHVPASQAQSASSSFTLAAS